MLYRPCTALIGVFWLVMAGLLVRQHVGASDAALRKVSVAHVVKLLLTHEQPSDLNIFSDQRRLGHLLTALPGAARQRIVWNGSWELKKR